MAKVLQNCRYAITERRDQGLRNGHWKAPGPEKFRKVAICVTIVLSVIFFSVPWSFLPLIMSLNISK